MSNYTIRATNAVADSAKQTLADSGTHRGPHLDDYIAAVDTELARCNIPALSADTWKRVAVSLAARLAGYEVRAAIDLEVAFGQISTIVDNYRRDCARAAAWQAAHPEPIAPAAEQDTLEVDA